LGIGLENRSVDSASGDHCRWEGYTAFKTRLTIPNPLLSICAGDRLPRSPEVILALQNSRKSTMLVALAATRARSLKGFPMMISAQG
jgi:hypothetical protein